MLQEKAVSSLLPSPNKTFDEAVKRVPLEELQQNVQGEQIEMKPAGNVGLETPPEVKPPPEVEKMKEMFALSGYIFAFNMHFKC